MSSIFCDKCGDYTVLYSRCHCILFKYKHEDYGNDWQEIYVRGDAEAAAEKVAENMYESDPYDGPVTVEIEGHGKFIVFHEYEIKFYANKIVKADE